MSVRLSLSAGASGAPWTAMRLARRWKGVAKPRRVPPWRPIGSVLLLVAGAIGSGAPYAQQAPPVVDGLAGQLLVATPEMRDPRFAETVIFMIKHDQSGAMGLVLNRPLGEVPVANLLEEFGIEGEAVGGDIRLHYGGPVEVGRGMVLHSSDYVGEGTVIVNDTVAFTAEREIVRAIAAGAGPRLSLITFGYAGWSPGQLEAEIANGGWITVPADEALVFGDDHEGKWRRAIARQSIEL